MRSRLALAATALLALSCGAPEVAKAPAAPDYGAQQDRIWSQIPGDARMAMTVADVRHFLGKLKSLRALLAAGPVTRKYLDQGTALATTKMGFDPLDAAGWKAAGFDTSSSVALFAMANERVALVFKASSLDAARASLGKWGALSADFGCAAHGEWMVCGEEGVAAAADPAQSLAGRMKAESGGHAGDELIVYAPLDGGRMGELFDNNEFARASKSAFLSLTMGDALVHLGLRYSNAESGSVAKYLTLEPNVKSVLGAATGARSAARFHFSPHALWSLARAQLDAKTLAMGTGAVQMATGLDLEKDIVDNLTGEMVAGFDVRGAGAFGAQFLGVRDDAKAGKLVDRLDGLMAGGLASVKDELDKMGVTVVHTVESSKGRPAYVFSFQSDPSKTGALGMPALGSFELHLATGPGAIVLAFDKAGREWAVANLGKGPDRFLATLEPGMRASFESGAPAVGWAGWYDIIGGMSPAQWKQVAAVYAAVHPDAPAILREVSALSELVWDTSTVFAVEPGAMSLDYQFNLL